MKLTRHNGRSGKNGAYNPKHNDREFDVKNSDHIDEERAKRNVYWDRYQGFRTPENAEQEEQIVYSFEDVERAFYNERYFDYCEGQHERNRKNGHPERNKSPDDLRTNKKTCPEESLIQIGTMEDHVPAHVLGQIAAEFFEEFKERFGEHVHILDWSLHLDEATPHIHERHVFDCENQYGEIAPQQEKALEALGIPLPEPDKPPSKTNNRKVSFDAICRDLLFEITHRHHLHLDHEPTYGGRAYLEKQDFIRMKQQAEIEKQNKRLKSLTVEIKDTETFIETVSEVAYNKATEVCSTAVREETRKADKKMVEDFKDGILSPKNKSKPEVKRIAEKVLNHLLTKFQETTKQIADRVAQVLKSPEKKEELKEPIRQSVKEFLKQKRVEADALNAAQAASQPKPKRKSYDMSL